MTTHLSLFTGIGGLDLAAEAAGMVTVGQCEWADYPTKVLEKHWPDVPRWRDIRTLTGDDFYARTGLRTVDVISGGFPCQPFSVAGKQKGKGDDRYLWPEMLRVITELGPRWIVGENVPGILRIAAADVVADLERLGYHVVVFAFEAAAVGAYHRRERVAFVAHNDGALRSGEDDQVQAGWNAAHACSETVVNATGWRLQKPKHKPWSEEQWKSIATERALFTNASGWPAEPDVGGRIDGVPCLMDGIGGLSDEAKARAAETLRNMWARDGAQALQWTLGRFDSISEEEVLLALLCEYAERGDGCCAAMESGTTQEGIVRELWRTIEAARTSHRREYTQQYAREYSDALLRLSHGAPSLMPQAWANGAWEEGITQVSHGIPNRVDRLKCLGNAVVPAQFYPIFKAIMEEERA